MTDTDIAMLKHKLHQTWAAGDYARIAERLSDSAESFLDRVPIEAGDRLLDIGCGAGQIAIPAAAPASPGSTSSRG